MSDFCKEPGNPGVTYKEHNFVGIKCARCHCYRVVPPGASKPLPDVVSDGEKKESADDPSK